MEKMDKNTIIGAVTPWLEERGAFLVDVSVSAGNDIEITFEKEEGTVDMDDCAGLDRFFHTVFDQETEDYSLTVSSAGLDRPFKVARQFVKAIGSEVVVSLKGGRRLNAVLTAFDGTSIGFRFSEKVKEGGRKVEKTVEENVPLDSVTSVKPLIRFE